MCAQGSQTERVVALGEANAVLVGEQGAVMELRRLQVESAVEEDLAVLAEGVAALALLAALVLPEVVGDLLSQPPVLAVLVDLARLAVLTHLAVPALPEVVVALAAEGEPEALLHRLSRPSFSAATARNIPQRTAPCELVPKSR